MLRLVLALSLLLGPAPARTQEVCGTALVLAIDVSNSVDRGEYRLQVDGLVSALSDPYIVEALIRDRVALSVLQWSGITQQEVSIPWRRMTTREDVLGFAAAAAALPRAFVHSGTAPGDAVLAALALLEEVPDCRRHVIDVSGDGQRNMGIDTTEARDAAQAAGVTVNALAIELVGNAISFFFRRQLVTSDGFVMAARGHLDYPRALRLKILRELTPPTG
ncbi:DUF1194 domain-containing protein [Rubellimicrobium roseum]|uniref:DUF1194 domain-containing protein n=1 Tax=Rubellimicrobium roseum TaxID=687525 RepID=A0A5C4NCS9_9RHOB|nr:DUF1194 domain-containing protein [Rubellimicrobium roseum]TNC72594.1 DUF1194 domain-containing protein [Rubellimicrobium roseum]